MKCRIKSGTVEAYQLTTDNILALEEWCDGDIRGTRLPLEDQVIRFHNGEEEKRAEIGDYIVHHGTGGFSTCTPAIFDKIYEVVE